MTLEQARAYALSLPETTEAPHFDLASFRVHGKIFATAPPAGSHLHVFVGEELRAPLIAMHPEVFEPLHWGAKVLGVRITLQHAETATVQRLLHGAWQRKAPRRLQAESSADVGASTPGPPHGRTNRTRDRS